MKFKDYCEFFAQIEKDPHALVEDFTVRNYLEARAHIQECEKCIELADRVLKDRPHDHDEGIHLSLN